MEYSPPRVFSGAGDTEDLCHLILLHLPANGGLYASRPFTPFLLPLVILLDHRAFDPKSPSYKRPLADHSLPRGFLLAS